MNKNTGIIIGIIALMIVVGGVYASINKKDDAMMAQEQMEQQAMEDTKMTEEKAMEENDAMMKTDTIETDSMMKEEETDMMENSDTMMKSGSFEAYAPEKVALASATHDVVLYFRASWCPVCRELDANIKANLEKIPSSLTILDVNFDNSTSLKQKYGVTYQHTFVQVDNNGNLIKKWSGSPTLASLITEIK